MLVDGSKAVIGPEVVKVLRDLVVQGPRQRLLVGEAREKSKPVSKALGFIFKAHLLLLIVDDLDNRTHNVREKDNAAQHVADRHENLSIGNWVKVTIAHCGQCGHGVVP